jgi:poly(3-hydroxybutyrate) depolymerase
LSNYSNGIDDMKEVLKRLKKDYYIDTSKIFLNGNCVGGQRALLVAENCPDYFSGIAVTSPMSD